MTFLDRLMHYSRFGIAGALIVALALPLFHWDFLDVVWGAVVILLLGTVVVSWTLMRWHIQQPCLICARKMPINMDKRAEICKPLFRIAHLTAGYLAIYLGVFVVVSFFLYEIAYVLWVVSALPLFVMLAASTVHNKYQPWCPRCRNGGGGEGSDQETPTPTPVGVA